MVASFLEIYIQTPFVLALYSTDPSFIFHTRMYHTFCVKKWRKKKEHFKNYLLLAGIATKVFSLFSIVLEIDFQTN